MHLFDLLQGGYPRWNLGQEFPDPSRIDCLLEIGRHLRRVAGQKPVVGVDCMSFPDLLVRLKRHSGFTMSYFDEHWVEKSLAVEGVLAELLQYEIDHLDGVLAVSRAVDGASFALRTQRHLRAGGVFANG